MKKLFTTISMLLLTLCLFAQAPQKMNYQAVVRNASNSLVANQNVSVRLSVLQGAATGASVYTETHTVNTNANGLMTLELGAGNAQSGTFASIDWANGPYYLKSEVDPDGGVNYNVVSTQQLLSVPYALYAAASGNGATGPQGPAGPQGPQGEPGQDGVSPTVTTTTTPTGTFVVISDANGNHQFFVSNGTDGATGPQGPQGERGLQGEQGEPGQDGYSPVVTITALDSMRTQVTITSEQHPDGQNFIVKNGSTGAAFVQDQADWLETNSSSNSYIVNKPDLSTVAITGNYNDLSNRPALSTVATTGSYNDLTGKPSMPAAANNATLTIQKNGAAVGTFSANASADKSINISVPTTTGELTNNSGFVSNSNCPTVNICDLQNTVADLQSAMNTMQTNMQATINTLQSTINTLQNTIANQNERIDSLRNAMSGGGPSISRPTVTTGSVSLITTTTASCEGYVTSDGGSDITERGVCYGTSQNPTVAGSKVTATGTTGNYTCSLTGLTAGTTYYVRAYATNSVGTAYGTVKTFTTEMCSLPTLTTLAVTHLSDSSAVLHGQLQSNGGDAQVNCGFHYGTSSTFSTFWTVNATTADFNAAVTGLDMNTTYYVRAFAVNAAGTSFGNVLSFTTQTCALPTVVTNAVDTNRRTKTSVTVSGSVSNNGGCQITNKGFCWSTGFYPTIADNVMMVDTAADAFAAAITGLQPMTTYYVRAFAVNHAGVSYGSRVSFTTLSANLPDLTTNAVTGINAYTATCGGRVTSSAHPVTARGVCWSTSHYPTVNDSKTTDGTGVGSFTSSLTGLTDDQTYYVRAYATIDEGTAYGNEVSFKTLSLPVVVTNNPSNITSNTVTLGGNVSNQGANAVTERGFCYAVSPNPTISGDYKSVGSGTGSFTCNLTGLTAGATYYVRAYATNGRGTAYGAQKTFTVGTFSCGTSTITDVDNNLYHTVLIGNQCWMKENLRTTKFSDSTAIDLGTSASTSAARYYYPENDNTIVSTFGLLYNWTAVMHGANSDNAVPSGVQGICPTGWHVPSDAEWTNMKTYVNNQLPYLCSETSTYIAKALASATGWNSSSAACAVGNTPSGNNATGFSAVPAGGYTGSYSNFGNSAYFWSSTQYSSNNAYYSSLGYNAASMERDNSSKSNGYSVRCLRDAEGLPVVHTATVTGDGSGIVTVTATVEAQGTSSITGRGVCYSTSPNPTIADSKVTAGSGMGVFTCSLTGLTAGITYYVRAYATNGVDTAYGDAVTFTTLSLACTGTPTVTDVDGNVYNTVQIGDQCWMRENLRTTKYSDGTAIALGTSASTSTAYRYNPDNNAGNVRAYGYLYNWKAVMRNSSSSSANPSGVQGVCPAGWHVPSDAEWTQLTDYVSSQSQYQCGGTSTNIAKALASTTGWISSPGTCDVGNNPSGNNATYFSALPASSYLGVYPNVGNNANFWSSTEGSNDAAYTRTLYSSMEYVYSANINKSYGYSVRCLKD